MKIAIYGSGGYGREILREIQSLNEATEIIFVETYPKENKIHGFRNVSHNSFVSEFKGFKFLMAIADFESRKKISQELLDEGFIPHDHFAKSSIVSSRNNIAEGCIFNSMSMVTDNVVIGKFCQINIYSYIAHDCKVGDYVTFAPKVSCNGNIEIKDNAYLGTGAIIRQGDSNNPLIIGKGAVVGMGAVVTKNVSDGETVVGNPAKPIKHKS